MGETMEMVYVLTFAFGFILFFEGLLGKRKREGMITIGTIIMMVIVHLWR